ncbi:MAG: FMN-binding protein [Bacillota bacterium]|nr:FMN-binding protein [Bacillota bacterium]
MDRKKRRILFLISLVMALTILVSTLKDEVPQDAVATEIPEHTYITTENVDGLRDGVYRARNQGFTSEITVELTVQNGMISDFKVVDHNETTQIAKTTIIDLSYQIAKNKSPKVDAVSGATETSEAIIKGARDTIRQAGGNPDDF